MFFAVSITIFKRNHFNRQGLVSGTEAKSCFLFSYTEELSYLLPFPASKFTIILRSCLNASDVFFQKAYGVWDGLTPNNGARPNFDRLFPNLKYLAQKLQIYIYMYTYTRISILSMFKSLFKSKLFFYSLSLSPPVRSQLLVAAYSYLPCFEFGATKPTSMPHHSCHDLATRACSCNRVAAHMPN